MKAKAKVISTLLVIDTFFVSYAIGFNSKHVLIVDPSLPAYVAPTTGTTTDFAAAKDGKSSNSLNDKNSNTSKASGDASSTGAPSKSIQTKKISHKHSQNKSKSKTSKSANNHHASAGSGGN